MSKKYISKWQQLHHQLVRLLALVFCLAVNVIFHILGTMVFENIHICLKSLQLPTHYISICQYYLNQGKGGWT